MTRPQIKANGGSPGVKASVGAGTTVALTLDSLVGVRSVAWSVESTDETANTTDYPLTISGSRGEIASFDSLGPGTAVIVRVTINNGLVQGLMVPAETTSTIKVYVETTDGLEVGATGETFESDAVHGTTGILNAPIRVLNSLSLSLAASPSKSVLYASTADLLTLSGTQTVDGASTNTGDRILLKNQSSADQNGVYVANSSGAWTRATDFDSQDEIRGATIVVIAGSTNAGRIFKNTNSAAVVVGSTAITFAELTNPADKTKLDAATSSPTANTIAMWDAGARMNANAFVGPGITSTLGVVRIANQATAVAMRDNANTGNIPLLAGMATDGVRVGDDVCEEVELRAKQTGTITFAASGFGTYARWTYDSGTPEIALELNENLRFGGVANSVFFDVTNANICGQVFVNSPDGVSLFGSGSYGGGTGVLFLAETPSPPTSAPTGGFFLYVEAGVLKAMGPGGTVTPLALA